MVSLSIAKMSSKGQIVIPKNMRKKFKIGEEILLLEKDNEIILKNKNEVSSKLLEDLDFSKTIKKAYEEYDKGNFISKSKEDFLEELDKW